MQPLVNKIYYNIIMTGQKPPFAVYCQVSTSTCHNNLYFPTFHSSIRVNAFLLMILHPVEMCPSIENYMSHERDWI